MAYAKGISGITRVVQRLIMQNGLMNGVKKAQKLGFPDAKIKKAVSTLHQQHAKAQTKSYDALSRAIDKRRGVMRPLPPNPYKRRQQDTFGQRKAERVAEQGGHLGFSSTEEMMANW